jgi:phosphoglycolate phosphatase
MTGPVRLPRGVLFDWDNTLVDSWGCIHASLNVTLEAMGHQPWSAEDVRRKVRRSMRETFPTMFGERWEEARKIFYDFFGAHHLDYLTPLPGAADLLAALAERGVYTAVVSNKTGRYLRQEAEALGWTGYFGRLVGATDAAADKPDLAPVTLALEPAGMALGGFGPAEVWFVGDADIDMECAHGAGCLPVLVGSSGENDFSQFPPAAHYDSCLSLCDLVRRLGDTISVIARSDGLPSVDTALPALELG